jgi:hypothetical protein
MAEIEYLNTLFNSHMSDLRDSEVQREDRFICPICFTEYSEEDLHNANLSDGHVWPEYIRKKSKYAPFHRVLLCKLCNNRAGSRGDKHMQLREIIRDANKDGQLYGERRIQIIIGPAETPVKLQATVAIQKGDIIQGRIVFQLNQKTGRWLRNNPKEQERFLAATQNDRFGLLVEPCKEIKPELALVGWITSAYLFAFYSLGYRYILHPSLDIVRSYILESFDTKAGANLAVPKAENFGLIECKQHYFENPKIGLVVPMNEETLIHLEVSFLNYHIKLPFHFVPHILQALILDRADVANQLSGLKGSEIRLYSPILCNKSGEHKCVWDYVLGKPIPAS